LFSALFPTKAEKAQRKLTTQMAQKATSLLGSTGYSNDILKQIYGVNFENVMNAYRPIQQRTTAAYQRAGMGGTGSEMAANRSNARMIEDQLADVARNILLMNAEKQAQDLQLAAMLGGQSTQGFATLANLEEGPDILGTLSLAEMLGQNRNENDMLSQIYNSLFGASTVPTGVGFDALSTLWNKPAISSYPLGATWPGLGRG
jgi:hypothetical protein